MADYAIKDLTRTVPSNEVLKVKKDTKDLTRTVPSKLKKTDKLKNPKFYGYSNIKNY